MCGVIGVVANSPVNQLVYDALLLLQHRGQDAAGMVTNQGQRFFMHKNKGMVRDVFRTRNMRDLLGNMGIGHVRYPTAGNVDCLEEAQPFYVNAPYGLTLAHNGNLTNTDEIRDELFRLDKRHINTGSDSEVLLNVLAHELSVAIADRDGLRAEHFFIAMRRVNARIRGAYACVGMVAGLGVFGFRDPNGIRPLLLGQRTDESGKHSYILASESVAIEGVGYRTVRDIEPGEAIWIDAAGNLVSEICAHETQLSPCLFEYVYFARPDSTIEGTSVYAARLAMGVTLAEKLNEKWMLQTLTWSCQFPIPRVLRRCNWHINWACRIAKDLLKTVMWDARLSCLGKKRVKNPCAKNSPRCRVSLQVKMYCWSMTQLCVEPPVKRLSRLRASRVPKSVFCFGRTRGEIPQCVRH